MKSLLTLGQSQPIKSFLGIGFRAATPEAARMAGEELLSRRRRVLALTAHPDDLEFFAGGTLHRLVEAGSHVHAWVLSDGEKHGSYENMGGVRRQEQRRAGKVQGFRSITFSGLPDFTLPEDPRLEGIVDQAWRRVKPDVVLAFDPQELVARMANRDHKALGRTVMDVARRNLHTGARVYFYGTRQPNVLVDLDHAMEGKLKAAECHGSQLVYLTPQEYRDAFTLFASAYATGARCQYAEGLYRLY